MKHRPFIPPRVRSHSRTLKVICAGCVQHYYLTLSISEDETYRDALKKMRCLKCGIRGKLATSDLAKAKPRPRVTEQLTLDLRDTNGKLPR